MLSVNLIGFGYGKSSFFRLFCRKNRQKTYKYLALLGVFSESSILGRLTK